MSAPKRHLNYPYISASIASDQSLPSVVLLFRKFSIRCLLFFLTAKVYFMYKFYYIILSKVKSRKNSLFVNSFKFRSSLDIIYISIIICQLMIYCTRFLGQNTAKLNFQNRTTILSCKYNLEYCKMDHTEKYYIVHGLWICNSVYGTM